MEQFKDHAYRVGSFCEQWDELPASDSDQDKFLASARRHIEPWLSAIFQTEHLNLLIGSGFTTAICGLAGTAATGMAKVRFNTEFDANIDHFANAQAQFMGRGDANIEDQMRSALAVYEGLKIIDTPNALLLRDAMDARLTDFLKSVLRTEAGIQNAVQDLREQAESYLQSFLLSFASRSASRERLHIFTTNYDRLVEHGCDLAGLRIIDRFVGALSPIFRSSRVEVDMHYNPPGIRGEPRFMEGVLRVTKLHGSLDWHYEVSERKIIRRAIPFGAPPTHTDIPTKPVDTVMIYPNPGKDLETTHFPYAELFRDFAASTCRPNSVVVTYGYGFGDDHVNRVLLDMLTIPSTHLVAIVFRADAKFYQFLTKTRPAQVTLLLGSHFASLTNLVESYLPKPALDYITSRMTELLKHRPQYTQTDHNVSEQDELAENFRSRKARL